ncbi:gliding motility-associated C-terminal domain-containing protein [Mucilaginibacter sp. UR6-1]|nr:gliding motility-associated C-terminal domain-containing protein [Mucilaginibacter sp. UR6-1]
MYYCLLMLVAGHTSAQTCTGSFGDPVVSESFDNPGPLPNGQAQNLRYVSGQCPENGEYTIVTSFPNSCHPDTWHSVFTDHTGNGGNMMVINASQVKSQFFEKRVSGLCGNTVYRFSIYVLDLMRKENTDPGVIHPALRFVIEDGNGNILTEDTKNIEPTYNAEFQPYGIDFATTLNTDEIVLKIFNDADGGYGNDLIIDDITFRACGPQVDNRLDGSEQDFTPECASSGNRNFMFETTPQPGYVYQWQKIINGDWQDITGATLVKYTANVDLSVGAIHQYRVAAAKLGNIASENCRVYSLPHSITIYAKPVLAPINSVTICRGDNAQVTLSGGAKYFIEGSDGFRLETTSSQYTFQPADLHDGTTTYTAYTLSAENCRSDNITFSITVKPPFTATATADKLTICHGESVQISTTTNIADSYTYTWLPAEGLSQTDIANPVATPARSTTYTVVVSNGACSYTQSVPITIIEPPAVTLVQRREMFEDNPIKLDPVYSGDITTYRWSPEEGLDDPTKPNPLVSPEKDTEYTVTLTGPCGVKTASVFVRVYQKITIPNTFTPNGDGINDVWNIEDLVTYPASETSIFNRNGQQVFRSIGYTSPWDGTFNSSQLPAGTYYYIIDLKNNTPKVAGYITLLR